MNGRTEEWTGGTNGRTGSMDGLEMQMVGRTVDGLEGGTERMDKQTGGIIRLTDGKVDGWMDGLTDLND